MERKQTEQTDGSPLSESSREGLTKYMEEPLRAQILDECDRNMPADVTFIFGHTHKPFQKDMNFNGYPQWVNVYNSGGWIVDTLKPEPLIGGSIILVDEDLNTTALRMYNQEKSSADYSVSIEEARRTNEESNPLYQRISELVKPSEEPWKTFSEEVARDVPVRMKNLQDKIIQ